MEETNRIPVDETGFCGRFDRIDASLIEEPESCEVCRYYCEKDSTCRVPEVQQGKSCARETSAGCC